MSTKSKTGLLDHTYISYDPINIKVWSISILFWDYTLSLLLTLHSGITPGELGEPYQVPGTEPDLVECKASIPR